MRPGARARMWHLSQGWLASAMRKGAPEGHPPHTKSYLCAPTARSVAADKAAYAAHPTQPLPEPRGQRLATPPPAWRRANREGAGQSTSNIERAAAPQILT